MKRKTKIKKLEERGLVGKWPPAWVPFFIVGAFALLGIFSEKLGLSWSGKLYGIAWFSFIWGVLHFWVVKKLKK